ncbi:hypothetical protein VKT23_000326 [Stygiomarasmius scandens]|uniref:Uncharacterized protein n=1 Tax=Marasmiellus scandens TaxID=2682957 RepID=A0ABR1K6F9_9AGAR
MPLKLPKPPKTKAKEYSVPDDAKYVVVVNPWSSLPPRGNDVKLRGCINNIGGWFEKMLGVGTRVNAIFHLCDKRDHVIVELPHHVDVHSILGAHRPEEFLKESWTRPPTLIYEYDFKRFGHPARKLNFDEAVPTYDPRHLPGLFKNFQENYPIADLPPPPRSQYNALPIPMSVTNRLSQKKKESEPPSSFQFKLDPSSALYRASSTLVSAPPSLAPTPAPEPPIPPSDEKPAVPAPDPFTFVPYNRPAHLYPVPGGSIVHAETREPTPGPSKLSESRGTTEPPETPASISSPKFSAKRDPYEEEDEAKFLLQSTPFAKEEPVDVQLEPAVIAKLEQVGDGLVAVKPEPVETLIPQDAFDAYMRHISTNGDDDPSSSGVQEQEVRVKAEPVEEQEVPPRVKAEPVETAIPEDLFNMYMQHQAHASAESNHDSSDQIEEDEDVSMAPPSRQEPVSVKPEPMDISLSAFSEDSGRESTPGTAPTRKRRRERSVDAVFGESSSNPGPSTSFSARMKDESRDNHAMPPPVRPANGSVKVKDEPIDRGMPPPRGPSNSSNGMRSRQRLEDRQISSMSVKPKEEPYDDRRALEQKRSVSSSSRPPTSDPRNRPQAPLNREERDWDVNSRLKERKRGRDDPARQSSVSREANNAPVKVKSENRDERPTLSNGSSRSFGEHSKHSREQSVARGDWKRVKREY